MPNLPEIRKNRIQKLKKIIQAGINPYPLKNKRTHTMAAVLEDFSRLTKEGEEIIIVGRLRRIRGHGGATFFDVEDGSGTLQVFLKKDKIGEEGYQFFRELFDVGDFVEIKGTLVKTRTGEKTIEASDFKMLTKSLLPLPEKWHGLQDVEERYRKRYLDLIFNKQVKEKFILRSKIIQAIRDFMEREGFLEVETPALQPIYGGARARPFKTHLNALNMDLYLRIATELYLKRLIVGGFDKVYEIGKCFRNEGMDKAHNPEYTHFEFYQAYADYKDLMRLTEQMFKYILLHRHSDFDRHPERSLPNFRRKLGRRSEGSLTITYENKKINFTPPFKRLEFSDLFQKQTKIKLDEINQRALYKKAKELGIEVEKERPKAEIADEIYKKHCRGKIIQPTFVIHHPLGFQPLAKASEKNASKLANFQLVIGGLELCNAFSELNDALEQEKRFKEQETLHKKGLEEAQRMDEEFLEALEYGMPPAAGLGMGIDRLVALLTDSHSLREIILFPTMRPKNES